MFGYHSSFIFGLFHISLSVGRSVILTGGFFTVVLFYKTTDAIMP